MGDEGHQLEDKEQQLNAKLIDQTAPDSEGHKRARPDRVRSDWGAHRFRSHGGHEYPGQRYQPGVQGPRQLDDYVRSVIGLPGGGMTPQTRLPPSVVSGYPQVSR